MRWIIDEVMIAKNNDSELMNASAKNETHKTSFKCHMSVITKEDVQYDQYFNLSVKPYVGMVLNGFTAKQFPLIITGIEEKEGTDVFWLDVKFSGDKEMSNSLLDDSWDIAGWLTEEAHRDYPAN